jgi:hypothetical protein
MQRGKKRGEKGEGRGERGEDSNTIQDKAYVLFGLNAKNWT